MIKFTGVNHLAMATGNMDETIRFWRDLLGMRLVAGFGEPGYRQYFFEISTMDMITFFEWPGVKPAPEKEHGRPVTGPFTFDHVSLGVETADDLWALKDRLIAADQWVSEVIDHGFIHSIYAFDPNGIPIEFSWNVAGIDVRANPMMGDSKPTVLAQEGTNPLFEQWPRVEKSTPVHERAVYPGIGSEFFKGLR